MVATTSTSPISPTFLNFSLVPESMSRFKQLTYAQYEHAWGYAGKMMLLTRHFLNVGIRTKLTPLLDASFKAAAESTIPKFKMLSGIGLYFSYGSLKDLLQKMSKGKELNDWEGLSFNSVAFLITSLDSFDTFTTVVNTARNYFAYEAVEIFSKLSLPVAYSIVGMGTISRIIKIAKNRFLSENLKGLSNDLKGDCKAALTKMMGIEEIQKEIEGNLAGTDINLLIEKKAAIISRMLTNEGKVAFESLLTSLKEMNPGDLSPENAAIIREHLDSILGSLDKKVSMETTGLIANLFSLNALILFSLEVGGPLAFTSLFIATVIRLQMHHNP